MIQLINPEISRDDLKRLIFDCNAQQLSPMFKLYVQSIPGCYQLAEVQRLGVRMQSLSGDSLNVHLPKDIWAFFLGGQFSNKLFIDDRRGGWNRYILRDEYGKSESEIVFSSIVSIIMATGRFHGEPIDIK